jgi:hypothetical protein
MSSTLLLKRRVTFELKLSSIVAIENSSIKIETNAKLMVEIMLRYHVEI